MSLSSVERAALESIKRKPERNPDGSLWKFHAPPRSWTKAYIVENWNTDAEMRKAIVERLMDLSLHMAGREP
jgi:hypothetical protein